MPYSTADQSYSVYILECADHTLYTGITNMLERRIDEHNLSDKGAKYTRARRPVTLVYQENHPDRSSASKREHSIKKMSRAEKIELISKTFG
ncbi:MAG: GIY-YIG nuclease family protein [Campylobacterota bacterium]|nr:GIY-YIG nuclease family protein [Campylobacterota bacterium]